MKNYKCYILLSILLFTITIQYSCHNHDHGENDHSAAEHSHKNGVDNNEVELTDEQCELVGITTHKLEYKQLGETVKFSGRLEVPAQNKAEINSIAEGVLKKIFVHPGAEVEKGQVIAEVMNTTSTGLQQEYLITNAKVKLAKLELNRQTELVNANAAPMKNLQRAQVEFESQKLILSSLKKQLEANGINVNHLNENSIGNIVQLRAPISGTISDIHGKIGSKIDPATPLATIVNNNELHLDLYVFEKDLHLIKKGQLIHFRLTNNPAKEYDAKIFSIGTAFADESKSIPIHAEVLDPKSELIEGMNVTAIVSLSSNETIAVPDAAIAYQDNDAYIFLKESTKNNVSKFKKIRIIKGIADLGYTSIQPIDSIAIGAEIVYNGAIFIMAKMSGGNSHQH
jgi:cobalt-zinc-cadmium efflux system membrane fusion protein